MAEHKFPNTIIVRGQLDGVYVINTPTVTFVSIDIKANDKQVFRVSYNRTHKTFLEAVSLGSHVSVRAFIKAVVRCDFLNYDLYGWNAKSPYCFNVKAKGNDQEDGAFTSLVGEIISLPGKQGFTGELLVTTTDKSGESQPIVFPFTVRDNIKKFKAVQMGAQVKVMCQLEVTGEADCFETSFGSEQTLYAEDVIPLTNNDELQSTRNTRKRRKAQGGR